MKNKKPKKAKEVKTSWKIGLFKRNCVLGKENYYISYNPFPCCGADSDKGETALVHKTKRGKNYCILNGDFRKQYEKLYPKGYKECKKFFDSKKKYISTWSN